MPKRFAIGTNLGLFVRRITRKATKATRMSRSSGRRELIESLENRRLLSSTYFVAPWGNDWSAGNVWQPFRTIQHAAQIANWGDTVLIRGGTYHETVHPWHSGVTFEAYNGENVTVSGADPIGNWQYGWGNVWKTWMGTDRGEGSNQLFVDGQMMEEARWPNTAYWDPSHPVKEHAPYITSGWGWATISDPYLSGGWQGAHIHIASGEGWYEQDGLVTASGPGWLTFTFQPDGNMLPQSGNAYYLYGKFQGLDSPGEWYRDYNGMLYFSPPGGSNPNWHDVEVKTRDYAFDLTGVSNTTLEGINIFAATINTNFYSQSTVIDHMHASYLSQFTWAPVGWQVPWNSGIELNGNYSVVENSTIGFSSGDGVYVNAANCRVTGNVIHDVDYNAGDSAGVRDFGTYTSIDHNVIYNTGRDGIQLRGYGAQVIGNTVHDAMLQTNDGGAIYTIRGNGWGSQIAWNNVYNVWDGAPTTHRDWYAGVGIFLDDNSYSWTIHDNNVWNTDNALKMNYSSMNNHIYNNYLAGWEGSIAGSWSGNWSGTIINSNNLANWFHWAGWGAAIYANW